MSNTSRFTVTMGIKEIDEIQIYTQATGVPRNELIRRATLAYIRLQLGKGTDVVRLFQQVGSIDQGEGEPCQPSSM